MFYFLCLLYIICMRSIINLLQYSPIIANHVSWVPGLTLLDLQIGLMNMLLNGTHPVVGALLYAVLQSCSSSTPRSPSNQSVP